MDDDVQAVWVAGPNAQHAQFAEKCLRAQPLDWIVMATTAKEPQITPHEAIRNVLGRYSMGVDDRDFDSVGACFAKDAIASYSGLTIPQGRDHIVEHIRGISRTVVSQHYLTPIIIEVDGDTTETLSYGMAVLVQQKDGETKSVARGLRGAGNSQPSSTLARCGRFTLRTTARQSTGL